MLEIVNKRILEEGHRPSEEMIECADKYGIELPKEYRESVNNKAIEYKSEYIEKTKIELQKAENDLQELTEGANK